MYKFFVRYINTSKGDLYDYKRIYRKGIKNLER